MATPEQAAQAAAEEEEEWQWDQSAFDRDHTWTGKASHAHGNKHGIDDYGETMSYRPTNFAELQNQHKTHSKSVHDLMKTNDEYTPYTPAERSFEGRAKPGMEELTRLVLDLHRDVKRINAATTKAGAEKVAKRMGKHHQAKVEDLNNDGIDEVCIYDKYGNRVVVNGYTTAKSDWPMRHAYMTDRAAHIAGFTRPEEKKRAKQLFTQDFWHQKRFGGTYNNTGDIFNLQYDPEKFNTTSNMHINNYNDKQFRRQYKTQKPGRRSAYQAFTALIHEACKTLVVDPPESKPKAAEIMKYAGMIWRIIISYRMLGEKGKPNAAEMVRQQAITGTIDPRHSDAIDLIKKSADAKTWFDSYVQNLYGQMYGSRRSEVTTAVQQAITMLHNVRGGTLSEPQWGQLYNKFYSD